MTNHNRRTAEVQWQAQSFDTKDVEPQKYAEATMEDGKLVLKTTQGWIASDYLREVTQ